MSKISTNKLSVYLIKDEYSDHKDILTDLDKLIPFAIDGPGIFYFGESHDSEPPWVQNFFGASLSHEKKLFNRTSKGVLLLSINCGEERIFALPFGYGWTLLNPGAYERNFGLRIVTNILDPNYLRKIGKKSMSTVPKDTSEQLSRVGAADDFGIDIEQDLIRSITGGTQEKYRKQFGKTVTGKDDLSISNKIDISNISDFLKECFYRYQSDVYKENFPWINQVVHIKDPKIKEELDSRLIREINKLIQDSQDSIEEGCEKIWMAVPDILEWSDVEGFAYKARGERYDDISLRTFLRSLSEEEQDGLNLELLKKKEIKCYSAITNKIVHKWSAFQCLYCELRDAKEKVYLLSNKEWYEIETNFVDKVDGDYKQICGLIPDIDLPNYAHKNENEYNVEVADKDKYYYCMDKKLISHGGGYSKVEFCDLFTRDKKMIHVKKYGGSSVLSHLFLQGMVAGELLLADEEFREKVNQKLPDSHKISNVLNKPEASNYQIIFAVISKSNNDLELPFFSKVNLRNAKKRLEAFGYKVFLQVIRKNG